MISIWSDTVNLPKFKPLEADISTDVLIIGGGIAGILCAHKLHEMGVDYTLIEADRICHKITCNTTAKITAQHGLIYYKLLKKFGADKTRMYLDANLNALNEYKNLCKEIDCDFRVEDSYVYAMDENKLAEEQTALKTIGYPTRIVRDLSLPIATKGAVRFEKQASFHPLKFLAHIAKKLHIYEHTEVREFMGTTVMTNGGRIRAEKIIVATHFPILNKHGSYFVKMYQSRSYVLALKNAQDVQGMYVDEKETGLSFRNYGEYLLLGGDGHRTGKAGDGWNGLSAFVAKHYPNATEVYRWATQDCMTLDGVPYIGQYSAGTPNLYVATGFNKWGMTSSMAAATILADQVTGRTSAYADVFSPSRSILHPQLAVNGFQYVSDLLCFTGKRCPHLGCALQWNPWEHSWDCPCHGSRFSKDGKLLDNPATGDMK